MRTLLRLFVVALIGLAPPAAYAANEPLSFLVISQRSPTLTAEYWNPILRHVTDLSGVPLELKITRTAAEHATMVARGDSDFIYSNHQLTPGNDAVGYRVIARMAGPPIRGQIVVLEDTPIKSLHDLRDKEVVFPSRAAFVGYHVPMDALLREKVRVSALFANNQEGAIAQLKARRAVAAAVNSEVMRDFAQRENIQYRVLWNSEPYLTIPIAAHPRVPKEQAERVSGALMALADESGGVKVLAASAKLIKQQPPFGFVRAQDADYENVRRFHKTSIVGKD